MQKLTSRQQHLRGKIKAARCAEIITSYGIKYSFHMGLHERDRQLLEFIKTKLDNRPPPPQVRGGGEVKFMIIPKNKKVILLCLKLVI